MDTANAFVRTALDPPRLCEDEVSRFFKVGWIVLRNLFERREVDEIGRAFDRLARRARVLRKAGEYRGSSFVIDGEGPGGGVRIHRVVWCGACEPTLERYGRDLRLLWPAARLLGSDSMHQLINQAHFKLPGDGVAFPWHQDSTHRRYGTPEWSDVNGHGSYVQSVLAIDPMTPDNGPLRFLPGSGLFGHVADPDYRVPEEQAVTLTMEPGDVAFFGPYVFHASEPNRSERPRRAFVNGFAYPGANRRVYPGRGAGRTLHTD